MLVYVYNIYFHFRVGVEVKSSKTQTKETSIPTSLPPASQQFFFDPYPSSHQQPSSSVSAVAPTHGQLIPMAIPLGEPRVGAGLSQPVTITTGGPEQGASVPMGSPRQMTTDVAMESPRQKSTNVAVVNVVSEKKMKAKLEMHVSKQCTM